MPYADAKYLCIDTETSGLDPHTCTIIELGAIVLDAKLQPLRAVEPLRLLIRPDDDHKIEAKAIQINGLKWVYDKTSEEWQRALSHDAALEHLHEWIGNVFREPKWIVTVGWNVSFDEAFLRAMYNRRNDRQRKNAGETGGAELLSWPFHYHKLDLLGIVRYLDLRAGRAPRKSYSLEAMSKHYFGADMAKFAMHTAMGDAQMCLKVLHAVENDM